VLNVVVDVFVVVVVAEVEVVETPAPVAAAAVVVVARVIEVGVACVGEEFVVVEEECVVSEGRVTHSDASKLNRCLRASV
jgi:hypothetical protein